ncbi:hypothetical protein EWM62_07075 [Mucilaginibacter terrigena]|uniref:Uncharacterized protein n=1 Tax=Mucilaginibacter terrigena TaxID=2492395 RepID=A0A4Q5LQR5_9SPHI|nr:hypothetical protein [Mucilaginibacter terrigena]RYU91693.1 hypothetical protein EWM62_07075 [Mucilaginibacter terrigena]
MPTAITSLSAPEQQHMLFLFLPMKSGAHKVVQSLNETRLKLAETPDNRRDTGVHFSMFYYLPAGQTPPGLKVKSFQTEEGKGLFVVQALYDADFKPYIDSFLDNDFIAGFLNLVLEYMDESGIVDDSDPTSANYILKNGKVQGNPKEFYCLLMRYNFGDPTLPAAAKTTKIGKYLLTYTFPGLTVSNILDNYPDAETLWPTTPVEIDFAVSKKPVC